MSTMLEKLETELEEANNEVTRTYGTYMYYECAERGYDAKSANEAHNKYLEALVKVNELKKQIEDLKNNS